MLKRITILGMIVGIVFACTVCASSQNQSSGEKDMLEKEDIVSTKILTVKTLLVVIPKNKQMQILLF